jgi:hypothetical protein
VVDSAADSFAERYEILPGVEARAAGEEATAWSELQCTAHTYAFIELAALAPLIY